MVVIGVDPGREKCGVAAVDAVRGVLARAVVATEALETALGELLAAYPAETVVLGDGTSAKRAAKRLGPLVAARGAQLVLADEYRTTDAARTRYWREHPPRGWRALLPTTMQTPPVPVDDYAAVILAERHLERAAQEK